MVTHILHIVDIELIHINIMITAIFCILLLLATDTENGKLYRTDKREEMAVMGEYENKMLQSELSQRKTGLCNLHDL